ncbi:hypothetical protein Mth01_12930 [Sphaerimonospora thailandensis]|uniref:Uncharacterized protein n=1 Tax=Sphaerimonospora thailandensis TaxID=795644 RepID=A0A8J3R601_9ACTN|nr:hypothetical protein Mth01_12930 [Sphaerimonospora thailandensis]
MTGSSERAARLSIAITLMTLLSTTACNNNPRHTESPDPISLHKTAIIKAVQCLVDNHAIPEDELRGVEWLDGRRLIPNAAFTDWYSTHENAKYRGQSLLAWTDQAEKAGSAWRCPL